MGNLERIKELISILNNASYAYYQNDNPIMSDKKYDDLYDELSLLEKNTGIVLGGSPTHKVQGYILDGLNKVKHSKPMLSADKTKDISEIKKFIGNQKCIGSWKEDGLTIVLRYKNGEFVQAITRGLGDIGEDVTHTMRMCKNIPMKIPYCADIQVRGEGLISWNEFDRINRNLEEPYKHPRNLAAGTVRQLDSNVAKSRNIIFKAFELVQDDLYDNPVTREQVMNIGETFKYLEELGFDVVEHEAVTQDNVEDFIQKFNPENYDLPVDGLIFTYDDYAYGKKKGTTSKFPLNIMALKWEDELYETVLRDVEWNTSKTGLINPVAIFDKIIMDGAETTRATLHNISYIEDLKLGIGDTITVYKANKIIPKVHENLTKSNTLTIPDKCPCCGHHAKIHNENGSKTLHCVNPDCKAKLFSKLVHAVSKNALNIDGLSESTLEKFINLSWISSIKDIYHLSDYEKQMKSLEGFGKKSVDKLLESVEKSRHTTLQRLLYAQSIPLIGKSATKDISKHCCDDIQAFVGLMNENYKFTCIDGFGTEMQKSLTNWWENNRDMFEDLMREFTFDSYTIISDVTQNTLQDKIFVITGKLHKFANRDTLVEKIESLGGKVSGSVSVKTNYLINNDTESSSSKNMKAKKLNIPIISEEDFLKMVGE